MLNLLYWSYLENKVPECTQISLLAFLLFRRSVVSHRCDPWTAACQASLSITSSRGLLKFLSIELVMMSNHLILWPPSPPALQSFLLEEVLHTQDLSSCVLNGPFARLSESSKF